MANLSKHDDLGENDSLGNIEGPYAVMRAQLFRINCMVLPHPALGFCDPQDEKRARELIEKIGVPKKVTNITSQSNRKPVKLAA